MATKRIFLSITVTLATVVILFYLAAYLLLGYSPKAVANIASVGTGIGAKLACSGHYVSGFNVEKMALDIDVYSPILSLLDYSYDDTVKTVTASLLGLVKRKAQYIENLGCALQYSQTDKRASLTWPTMPESTALWPKGNQVTSINNTIQKKLDGLLAQDNKNGEDTRALVVVHKGNIIAESYKEGINQKTKLLGWSMTKGVNSIIVGHLEMHGKIARQEANLFPEWQDKRANITIENLLQMTDGLEYEEVYNPGNIAVRMLFQEPDPAKFMRQLPLEYTPGTHYNYSSGATNLLSNLVQQRIEGDLQADINYLAKNIFQPLGMNSVTYEMDRSGLFIGSSYMFANARDWARIGQLMLNRGTLNGTRIMSENYVQRALMDNNSSNKKDYGYQWWLNTSAMPRWPGLPTSSYGATGNRGQRIIVIPDKELVIIRLGWSPNRYLGNNNFSQVYNWLK